MPRSAVQSAHKPFQPHAHTGADLAYRGVFGVVSTRRRSKIVDGRGSGIGQNREGTHNPWVVGSSPTRPANSANPRSYKGFRPRGDRSRDWVALGTAEDSRLVIRGHLLLLAASTLVEVGERRISAWIWPSSGVGGWPTRRSTRWPPPGCVG